MPDWTFDTASSENAPKQQGGMAETGTVKPDYATAEPLYRPGKQVLVDGHVFVVRKVSRNDLVLRPVEQAGVEALRHAALFGFPKRRSKRRR